MEGEDGEAHDPNNSEDRVHQPQPFVILAAREHDTLISRWCNVRLFGKALIRAVRI